MPMLSSTANKTTKIDGNFKKEFFILKICSRENIKKKLINTIFIKCKSIKLLSNQKNAEIYSYIDPMPYGQKMFTIPIIIFDS